MILTVTPTQRLAASIQQNQEHRTLVLSWNAWLCELWNKLLSLDPYLPLRLTAWQSQRIWRSIVQEETPGLLNVSATTFLAWEAWQHLHRWKLALDYCVLPSIDVAVFLKWAHKYQSYCQKAQAVDEVTFLNTLIAKAPLFKEILPQQVHCVGFDDWPPQWQQWIEVLVEVGVEVSYPHENKSSRNESCIAYHLTEEKTEWRAAALWVRGLLEAEVKGSIAVVIPNLSQAREEILGVFNSVLNPWASFRIGEKQPKRFNISGGNALSKAPVIETALILLQWVLSGDLSSDLTPFLLKNPYLKTLPSLGNKYSWPEKAPALDWIAKVVQLLDLAGWPGERVLHSDGYQAVLAWGEVLKTLKTDLHLWGELSYFDFYRALSDLCAQTLFQTQSIHEKSNVHVLGILEAAGLEFEYAWVSGLYEGQWPQPPSPNPFIDFTIQRQQNMPHASSERETAFAQKILKRLVTQTRHIVLSSPEYKDLKPVLESQLIFEHTPSILGLPLLKEGDADPIATLFKGDVYCEYYQEGNGSPCLEEVVSGGVSILKTQALCPYQAYATHRLGLISPLKTVYGLSGQERGQWLHKALEIFWNTLKSQENLKNLSSSALEQLLDQVVTEARPFLKNISQSFIRGAQFWRIESSRMKGLLWQVCLWEKSRSPFKVQSTEYPQPISVEGLRFKGRIDRIDEIEGGVWVIDYKTAPQRISDWLNERLIEPQLPLYALNGPKGINGIMALEIHPKKIKAHLLEEKTVESNVGVRWGTLVSSWENSISKLAIEFKEGGAMVDPVHSTLTCRYCHCQAFCRRFEGVENE